MSKEESFHLSCNTPKQVLRGVPTPHSWILKPALRSGVLRCLQIFLEGLEMRNLSCTPVLGSQFFAQPALGMMELAEYHRLRLRHWTWKLYRSLVSHVEFGESTGLNVWESTKPGNDRIGQSNTTYIENQRKTLFVDHSIMPPKIRRCSMFFSIARSVYQ
jgi:hypothetical protein